MKDNKDTPLTGKDLLDIYNHLEYAHKEYFPSGKLEKTQVRALQTKITNILKELKIDIVKE